MAAIVATDVAYVPLGTGATLTGAQGAQEVAAPGRVRRQWKLTFPAVNQDYPAGGVPLDKGKLNCLRGVAVLKVMGQTPIAGDTNFLWGWNGDPVTPKLVAFQGGSVGTAPFRETALTGLTVNSIILFVDVEST